VTERAGSLAVAGLVTTLVAATSLAAEEPSSDVTVAKDLTAVIALQGLPCGEVISARQQGEDDYIASCKDGNRYRVFVNADGRVMVEKLD